MPKNIVICCDGTGNEIEVNLSNVLKLYRCLDKKDPQKQIVYYDTGIGTISEANQWQKYRNIVKAFFAQITGFGMDQNVLDAYSFLVDNYETDDRIYLLGFSRGAYTVRVLAGFLRGIGLLKSTQRNLFKYALASYKNASSKQDPSIGWRIHDILDADYVPIKFLGVWDTVSSVIVPGLQSRLETLAYTDKNELVETFRHAIAIDERRRMFRTDHWEKGQIYKPVPFLSDDNPKSKAQDSKQVWFAGVHSDVGGGYPEAESQIAKFPLRWMMDEAKKNGLFIKTQMYNHLAKGKLRKGGNQSYVAPDSKASIHESDKELHWKVLEFFPKADSRKECTQRISRFGMYIPFSEPRYITEGSIIHESAIERIKLISEYNPENLPAKYTTEKIENNTNVKRKKDTIRKIS